MNKETTREIYLKEELRRDHVVNLDDPIRHVPHPSIPPLEHDKTFGLDGRMTLNIPGHTLNIASSITPTNTDNELKFWVTAYEYFRHGVSPLNFAAVARITDTGQMDLSFGTENSGFVQIAFDQENYTTLDFTHELADGRLVVFGVREGRTVEFSPMITRILPTGILDISFGNQGIVDPYKILGEALNTDILRSHYAVTSSGKILILALIEINRVQKTVLAQLTEQGALDLSFQKGGLWIYQSAQPVTPTGVLQDSSTGKIIIACSVETDSHLICLDSEGELDTLFGDGGHVDLSAGFDVVASCSLSQDNRHLLITGAKGFSTALACYLTRGKPEKSFNKGLPVYMTPVAGKPNYWIAAQRLAAPPNTTTVIGWAYNSGGFAYNLVGRYSEFGAEDGSLANGSAVGGPGNGEDFDIRKNALAMMAAGKLLIAGDYSDKAAIFAFKDNSNSVGT